MDTVFVITLIGVLISLPDSKVHCRSNSQTSFSTNHIPFAHPLNSAAICRTVSGLTRAQLELCQRRGEATLVALEGLKLAVRECQHQFKWNRWNCSSLAMKNYPHNSVFFQRGYRESAYAYAIAAAGIAHFIARACSQGRLVSCGCDPSGNRPHRRPSLMDNGWKWGGCSHNIQYGLEFSKLFLDVREQPGDIHSRISLHNYQAGRLAVSDNMQVRCKCHGMSGSCELKTCWKTVPDFRKVGRILKNRFRSALQVDQSNMGNGPPVIPSRRPKDRRKLQKNLSVNTINAKPPKKKNKKKKGIENELLFYQKSPNFCEKDASLDVFGTMGRICNKTSEANDGCGNLCCGRGYNMIRRIRTKRCNCKFHWCCEVKCEVCTIDEWIPICINAQ